MRRVEPSDFRHMADADRQAFVAWMATHGFNVQPVGRGGDYVEAVDVQIPADRVWPEGTTLTWGLEDCWMVVYMRMRPDGSRPTVQPDGTLHRSELIMTTRTVPMICRPPGCVLALLNDGRPWRPPPNWTDAVDELVDLERRLRLGVPRPQENSRARAWGRDT